MSAGIRFASSLSHDTNIRKAAKRSRFVFILYMCLEYKGMRFANNIPIYYIRGMEEQWKPVKGFENYQISNFGRVQSFSRKHPNGLILKPKIDRYGYEVVCIGNIEGRKYRTIHRLVALAFIENPEGKATINH